ncbi:flagellar operon protein [Gottschalkia acidurici 9a]|uniref:Flagellar operon protein n=1 Tax=Gottschalkia acidurici (strain ATCC 7906 / DSM 604 / BCRC 14475 / CIP 104303 / KCTC 5404 / NCIMB 10678 / 9a) TaxID=1128398 RepID=K0AZA6_GOTA9|nr:TIGR02530 family flagellar biosynthesis protein [Gottschalkia acidurici]AFS78604.1 flagellar operon protein [Gottschalkia acidurici 9a]
MKNINLYRINSGSLTQNYIKNNSIQNKNSNTNKNNFEEMLSNIQSENKSIKFSKHAKERMDSRNIILNDEDIEKIEGAIGKAEEKGVKEALILMENKAFIANIKNKTIITTVTQEQLKDNLFTNIDGAVII